MDCNRRELYARRVDFRIRQGYTVNDDDGVPGPHYNQPTLERFASTWKYDGSVSAGVSPSVGHVSSHGSASQMSKIVGDPASLEERRFLLMQTVTSGVYADTMLNSTPRAATRSSGATSE